MQRFQFRLERVLEWRRKQCRMEENRLAACFGLVQATERKIEQLRAERTSIDRELLTRYAIPAADLLNLGLYRLRANQQEIELAEERRQRVLSASEQCARVQRAQRTRQAAGEDEGTAARRAHCSRRTRIGSSGSRGLPGPLVAIAPHELTGYYARTWRSMCRSPARRREPQTPRPAARVNNMRCTAA